MSDGVELWRYSKCPSPLRVSPAEVVHNLGEYIDAHMDPGDKGLLAFSGGVDSSVVAKLCQKAGANVVAVHIDHGFMRTFNGRGESEMVAEAFSDYPNFILQEARDFFYRHVFGVEDAEAKRDGFKTAYSELLKKAMEKHGATVFLDGTIAPDIEETEAGLKGQHNVGIEDRYGAKKVIEPLAGLVKAEVRAVAKELGIDYLRPPFPGPGLAVRTPGAIDLRRLDVERHADDIVETMFPEEMVRVHGAPMIIGEDGSQTPFQYFAATFNITWPGLDDYESDIGVMQLAKMAMVSGYLTSLGIDINLFDGTGVDLRSLGTKVTGKTPDNKRVYNDAICISGEIDPGLWAGVSKIAGTSIGISRVLLEIESAASAESKKYDVAIRAVDSVDARTATVTEVSQEFLGKMARRITDECEGVGSVYLDITPKPPGTIEFE